VSMIKSVPNLIYYHQEFSQIFSHLVSIFLMQKAIFENFSKRKSADVWGPPFSGQAATHHAQIGCPGWHCHRARAIKAPTLPTDARV
jgi:hypothetical protein